MKTYEVELKSTDGSLKKTIWIHRSWYRSMEAVIDMAFETAKENGMAVENIKRID